MKVLVGIDGSDHSFAAAALAGGLLAAGRDRVVLYHSCDTVTFSENVDETLHERACQAVANVIFAEATARLPAAMQADVETIIGDDRDAQSLVEAAERAGAEMIAVGARGLGRMEGLLLGSMSSGVVRSARVPVLIARTPHERAAPDNLRVFLAYDRISAKEHSEFIGRLSWPDAATGRVAVVIESMLPSHLPAWIQRRARDADTEAMSQVWVREHQQERDEKERELAAYAQQLPSPFRSDPPIVVEGNPAEQLMKLIGREKPTLVVVGKAMKNFFDRWFLGSVSEKILAHADCSVLVIPSRQA